MPLTKEEVQEIVRETMQQERRRHETELDVEILKGVSAILTGFGIDNEEKKEIREDFRYLRRWRMGADKVSGLTVTALVTLVVGGLGSAIFLGIKALLGKP